MKVIKHELEHDSIKLKVLSDLHIGSMFCDIDFVEREINEIKNTPNMYTILNGDLVNMALKHSLSDVYKETMSPEEQIDLLYEILKPIKHKILGFTLGNHTERVNRTVGIDLIKLLSRSLGLEHLYQPEGIVLFLTFGKNEKKQTASFYVTHKGTSAGRRSGGAANGVEDLNKIIDVDCYIRSHVHKPMLYKLDYIRTNKRYRTVDQVTKMYVVTGAAMSYGGYGQMGSYGPSTKLFPEILLESKQIKKNKYELKMSGSL